MTEMDKLAQMLDDAGIEYVRLDENENISKTGQMQLIAFDDAHEAAAASAICREGSYGYEFGFLECWNYKDVDASGFLNALGAFRYISNFSSSK